MTDDTPTEKRERAQPIPEPPHPSKRREPLPSPVLVADDPLAAARIRALLASPTYRPADRDVDFLDLDEIRGVRLQLDYVKTEQHLRTHDVAHTIVVFGSTRIPEPAEAERRLRRLREDGPDGGEGGDDWARRLAVAQRIVDKSRYYEVARELGRIVGEAEEAPEGGRLVVTTGGGPGIMEAANRGGFDVGARSIGLNIGLPEEQYPNAYITPELCFQFHYFAIRKLHFMLRARALVAFPGGYGTLDELFETLTLVQTRTLEPVPVVLVGESFWRRAFDVDFLVDEGVIDVEDRELFWYAETAREVWDGILRWHELAGRPLCPVRR